MDGSNVGSYLWICNIINRINHNQQENLPVEIHTTCNRYTLQLKVPTCQTSQEHWCSDLPMFSLVCGNRAKYVQWMNPWTVANRRLLVPHTESHVFLCQCLPNTKDTIKSTEVEPNLTHLLAALDLDLNNGIMILHILQQCDWMNRRWNIMLKNKLLYAKTQKTATVQNIDHFFQFSKRITGWSTRNDHFLWHITGVTRIYQHRQFPGTTIKD